MNCAKPADVVSAMIDGGHRRLALAPRDLLIRGMLAGAILGATMSLAFTGVLTTGQPLVGAIIFPVGLAMIVLLGLEIVTGNFGLLPLARFEYGVDHGKILTNWAWVFLGNLLGSLIYGLLLAIALTNMGAVKPTGVAAHIIAVAEAKTLGYAAFGAAGLVTAFINGIFCNWMVCLAIVLAMTTNSMLGKIVAIWMPIFLFVAQGFEHAVVNMFVISTGMLLGANVTISDWWLWNQIPVTLGNLVGGFVFTGALYLTHKPVDPGKPARLSALMQPAE